MVFESIVADLLNRLLGDYFENFDPSRLSIGIWGGDVILRDLYLKTSALDDLGLPFKIVAGKLGSLTMRIPWKSLYTSPVELDLKNLLLLVVPSTSVAYNEEAEERAALEAKLKELARLDEVRKKEQERKRTADALLAPETDTFAEKLITQIIKNVQIRIESIHVRYEDAVTKPSAPFAFGVALRSLKVETTDSGWKPKIISEMVQTIHKIASLDGLSLYWNSNTAILSRNKNGGDRDLGQILEQMVQMVVSENAGLKYVVGPIASDAKVKLTPSPEKVPLPFSLPKAIVEVVMTELAIGMTNRQFQDIMQLADAMDSMTRAQYYRKYRRQAGVMGVGYRGHYRAWWKFAYRCIAEEDVKRKQKNWDWAHIKEHCQHRRAYHKAYLAKLTLPLNKNLTHEAEVDLQYLEKRLDLFNLTLVRKNVELIVDRLPLPPEPKETGGWFSLSGWFGGGEVGEEKNNTGKSLDDIGKKFEEALTNEEKAKLYSAIDYKEESGPIDYPREYVEYNLHFNLLRLRCTVKDEDNKSLIMELVIANVGTLLSTRPVRNCLKVEVKMGSMEMVGSPKSPADTPPNVLTTKKLDSDHLFQILFETNPLDSPAVDQRIAVSAQPLQIVYDWKTVAELVKCFTLPNDIHLSELQAQTQAALNEWKERSTTGLAYLIESQGVMELQVDITAPYILVPRGGELGPSKSVLILDLGQIHLSSRPRTKIELPNVTGQSVEEHQQSVFEKSYDKFDIKLKDLQILLTLPGEDYMAVLDKTLTSKEKLQPTHLFRSSDIEIQVDQCLITDDVRLPKMKVSADLPTFDIDISEHRLIELVDLVTTLPLLDTGSELSGSTLGDATALTNNPALAEAYAVTQITYHEDKKKGGPALQFIDLVMNFKVEAISLKIGRGVGLSKTAVIPLVKFELKPIRMKYISKTFGDTTYVDIGGVTLEAFSFDSETDLRETIETVDTNALIMSCEVSIKMASHGTKSNIMGAVNRLTLSTSIYNPLKRTGARAAAGVISPMSVNFVMSESVQNGTLIDVNISDIFIRLTAGTLELLINIATTISGPPTDSEDQKEGQNYLDIWKAKHNNDSNYWFLKQDAAVEVAEEALQLELPEHKAVKMFEVAEDLVVRERLVLESGCIVLTFETGSENNATPILLIETDIDLQLFSWSTRLEFGGRLKLEAAYYNAIYGMWEFLIEPVENKHHGKVSHQAWELLFEYSTVDCIGTSSGDVHGSTPSPTFMAISLASHNILELTITKAALEVLNMISEDFNEAVKALVSQRDVSTSPYTVVNDCGSDLELDLSHSGFSLVREGLSYDRAQLKPGKSLNLALVESYDMTRHHTSILREQEGKEERVLKIIIPEYGFHEAVPVNRAEKRYYDLKKRTDWGSTYGLICDISVKDCSKIVTIRGVVQIQNELSVPVDVYSMDNSGNTLALLGTAENGKPYNVPLTGVYTKSCEFFFAPMGHTVATIPYIWTSTMDKLQGVAYLTSKPRNPTKHLGADFNMQVIGQVRQALWRGTNRKTIASQYCTITLKPPLILNNLLPIPLGYYISGTNELITTDRGNCVQITSLEIHKREFELKLRIPAYENDSWVATVKINKATHDLSTRPFQSEKTGNPMSLGIHKEEADEILVLHVYCPSWMINRTGLNLLYKGEVKGSPVTRHPATVEQPVLFSFPEKAFFSKKKAMVSIDGKSEWSEKFSLDVAGSCGSVTCPTPTSDYQVGVEIVLTSWGLTKTIIFTPRFYLVNQCQTSILVYEKELSTKSPLSILSNKTVEFWPKSKVQQVIVCFDDEPTVRSKPTAYDQAHNTLLEMPNKYGGIHVDVHVTEVKTMITFSNFIPGQAPALLVNATPDCSIEISEKGVDTSRLLAPNTSQLITWTDPTGKRTLTWTPRTQGKKNTFTDKLHGDGTGLYEFVNNYNVKRVYYWVCFLDGLQRVLLFTPDPLLCAFLQQARDIEVPTADYTVMLHGIGLSLVDDEKCKELMYMRIASSEIGWETSKPGKRPRFKPLPKKDSQVIEAAYQNYLNRKAVSDPNEPVKSLLNLDIGIVVDFLENKILKPKLLELRRMFQHGLWLHYKQFPHSTQIHAKLNRLQIDNQLQDCIFRIVLAPVPPPKSVSARHAEPKPFAEVSIMQRMTAHSSLIQYKYFKVLIQEFHIRLDINFVNSLVDLFSNEGDKRVEHMVEGFNKDYDEASTSLEAFLGRHNTSQGQKHFYDFLHFSPLKIHVSFSMGGATQLSNNFLNLLLQSVGVTLTEIQDIVFKLACLELQHMFLSGDELYDEAYSHYSSQAIKQLYVLVLGLDVIGNPYGLVMGVTEGVEAFFYEPFQGAIQGPGEFAEGLALGVRSLVGSTIGGAAGALGKITGTLGKGLAALTMDEDYQRKRRENLSKKRDVAGGMAQSGKGLVMGFVGGVTGVFAKPIQGAKKEGVGGFFKGLGKGAVGLVARPTAGIVDFTSGTFDAVKKATSTSIDVQRMRPTRHVPADSVLLPYVQHEAEGMQLLHELDKGKYISTDTYIAHALVNPHGIFVLLLTNKRLFYLKKEEIFGGMSVVRSHMWEELDGPPVVAEKGLKFLLKMKKKKKCFSSEAKEFFVPLYSTEVCTWLLSKIETALKTETLDGSTFAPGSVVSTPVATPTASSSHQNNQGHSRNSRPKS